MVLGTLWSHVLEQKADASPIPHCFLSAQPPMAMPVGTPGPVMKQTQKKEKGQQCNWQSPGDASRPAPAPAQAAESVAPQPLLPEPSSLPPSLALLWTSPQPSLPVYRTPCTHTRTHTHTHAHAHTHTCTHTHAHTHTRTHTHMRAHTHTHAHTLTLTSHLPLASLWSPFRPFLPLLVDWVWDWTCSVLCLVDSANASQVESP